MKIWKHNATSRIIVGQREGRKEPTSYMRAPANDAHTLKPGHKWIDCPQDKAKVLEIMNRGRTE